MSKGLSEAEKRRLLFKNPLGHFDAREFACGWYAAFVNICLTYPVHKIIFRQMLHGVKMVDAIHQMRKEGLMFLYRGMFPPLAQRTLSLSLMFGIYEGTKQPLIEVLHCNCYSAKIIAGIIAGTVETTLMPFERIQTLLADTAYHGHFKNTPQAVRYIWLGYGFKEFYRGLVPILCRNGPSSSLFFVLKDEANKFLPKQTNMFYQNAQQFTAGAFIGTITSTIFYPLNVVKVYMQSTCGGPYVNFWTVFLQIYRERGSKFRNIYKGVSINCTRAFFSWGIMNAAYEQMKRAIY